MLEAGLAYEITDLVNEKIKIQERFHELKISIDPEKENSNDLTRPICKSVGNYLNPYSTVQEMIGI